MPPLDNFKSQLIGYMSYYDLGDISDSWKTGLSNPACRTG